MNLADVSLTRISRSARGATATAPALLIGRPGSWQYLSSGRTAIVTLSDISALTFIAAATRWLELDPAARVSVDETHAAVLRAFRARAAAHRTLELSCPQ